MWGASCAVDVTMFLMRLPWLSGEAPRKGPAMRCNSMNPYMRAHTSTLESLAKALPLFSAPCALPEGWPRYNEFS